MNRHTSALLAQMERLSQKYFGVNWEEDLEYILFDVVKESPTVINGHPVDSLDLRELSNLFEMANGIWTGDAVALEFISWDTWKQRTGLSRGVGG